MHHLNHVHRRGTVYVWRRRFPHLVCESHAFIQVSLKTREFSTAKIISRILNCVFLNFLIKVKQQKITRVEAQRFLTAIVSIELERIEAERYTEPHAKTPGDWRNRYLEERARAIALRKIASMGTAAQLFEEDRTALTQEFTHDDAFERVERHIWSCRIFVPLQVLV